MSSCASLEVCHALIRSDLLSLVDDWHSLQADERARKVVAQRIALLICVIRIRPSSATHQAAVLAGETLTLPWAETMMEVYRKLAPHKAAYENGLVTICVEVCRRLGPVSFRREAGKEHIIESASTTSSY